MGFETFRDISLHALQGVLFESSLWDLKLGKELEDELKKAFCLKVPYGIWNGGGRLYFERLENGLKVPYGIWNFAVSVPSMIASPLFESPYGIWNERDLDQLK